MIKMHVRIESDDRIIERNFEGEYWTDVPDWQYAILLSIPELEPKLAAELEEGHRANQLIEDNWDKLHALGVRMIGFRARARIMREALAKALERIPHAIK